MCSEEKSRESLVAVLDAWKSGCKADEMRNDENQAIVRDPDWKQGRRLIEYEIGGGMFDGKNLRVPVTLTFDQKPGGSRKVIAKYIVGTEPIVTLFRDGE
jgi:hypothetical protein